MIYTYPVTIAAQYFICITQLDNFQKLTYSTTDKPPTFLFYPRNFENTAKYHTAYMTMILVLTTKLKNGVMFGNGYTSIALTIHPYAINGYEILYKLISYVHTRLVRNKATQPLKTFFDGDKYLYTTL